MFLQYEEELDKSNQIIKSYENYIDDDKIKNDVLNKFLKKLLKNVNSDKKEIYKKNSMNRFIKLLYNIKRELQPNKNYCGNGY